MSKLYFSTHAEVVIDKDIPIEMWPLSDRGKERFEMFLKQPWLKSIDTIYCSSEQKALDGAKIVSEYLNKPFTEIPTIGEFDRSSTGYQPKEIFVENVKLFFGSPNTSILGWETAQHTQDRVVKAFDEIINISKAGNILVVAHGGIGSLYLAYLLNEPINIKWNQHGNGGGNYFVVDLETLKVIQQWQPIDLIS